MSDLAAQPLPDPNPAPAPEAAPRLTQIQRVIDTFTSPSKTFADIKAGNKSWWLPFVIGILASYIFFAAIYTRIGMDQVVQNSIHMNAKTEQQLADAPADRRAMTTNIMKWTIEGAFLASPVISLAAAAVLALGLWGTINFAFGGKATFGSIFAVWMYAGLPAVVKVLLGIIVMYVSPPDGFNINNFAPTNIAAFLSVSDTNKALYMLLSRLDVITIWTLVLLGIGTAIVAGTKKSSGMIAVFGWWIIFVVIGVGFTAAFS